MESKNQSCNENLKLKRLFTAKASTKLNDFFTKKKRNQTQINLSICGYAHSWIFHIHQKSSSRSPGHKYVYFDCLQLLNIRAQDQLIFLCKSLNEILASTYICDITAQTELVEWKETFFYCIVNVMLPYHRYVIESYTFTLIRKLMWERIERVVGVIVSETVNSCRVLPELAGNWMISLATSTHSRLRFYLETLSLKQNRVSRSKLTIEKIISRLLQK